MKTFFNIKNIAYSLIGLLLTGSLTCCKKQQDKISKGNILVLDGFYTKVVHINDDSIPDASHGDVICEIIKNGLPDYNVEARELDIYPFANQEHKKKFYEQCNDKKYDAVNISNGISAGLYYLTAITRIKLTPDNIASKAKELKEYIKNNPDVSLEQKSWMPITMGGVADILDVLDSLSAKGTKIYVSSTNEGPYRINLLSLADNSVYVGSMDKNGIKEYSGSNSLIKRYHNDELKIKKVKDGYSIDGGKHVFLNNSQVSTYSDKPYSNVQSGSSFATPRVLVMDINKH